MATGSKKARSSAARLAAVQCVHQMLISPHLTSADTFNHYCSHLMGKSQDGDDYVPADTDLLSRILRGVDERRQTLGDMILGAMQGRETARLPEPLLLAVMLCGAQEILSHHDTDVPLIIKEYMHVADGFFSGNEAKMVNAVLDKLAKSVRDANT